MFLLAISGFGGMLIAHVFNTNFLIGVGIGLIALAADAALNGNKL